MSWKRVRKNLNAVTNTNKKKQVLLISKMFVESWELCVDRPGLFIRRDPRLIVTSDSALPLLPWSKNLLQLTRSSKDLLAIFES